MVKVLKIVFMGTPDFAVPSLEALHHSSHTVAAVVTQPDRRRGRGRKVSPSPVKAAALANGYPVFQPQNVRDPAFMAEMASLKPDMFVVIAFGHILHQPLLDLPTLGAVNIHASLLPKYRGPAPIQWAIINNEKETGVTAMFMDRGLDSGDILKTSATPIQSNETSGSLHDRLSRIGAELLVETLQRFADKTLCPVPQNPADATYAPLLKKNDGNLDWNHSAKGLECRIRGVTPWPGAFTFFNDRRLKIFSARVVEMTEALPPGTVIPAFSDEIRVAAGQDALSILEIQSASGKRMHVRDFLKGCRIPVGTSFTQHPGEKNNNDDSCFG